MEQEIVSTYRGTTDLKPTDEYWQSCTYSSREKSIIDYIKEHTGGYPSRLMMYIREMVFDIDENTTIYTLQQLAIQIRKKFKIDCFQISIDRDKNQAHMLFDWYDRDQQSIIFIYPTLQHQLSAMIFQNLNLALKTPNQQWLRYLLKYEFERDPQIYDNLLEWIKHQSPSQKQYKVMKTSLDYIKCICQGLVK